MGQLKTLIRSQFLIEAIGFNKVQGKPFGVSELVHEIESVIA